MTSIPVLFFLGFGLALFAGMIVLQFYLSKRNTRWYGLILPVLAFLAAGAIGIANMANSFQTNFFFSDLIGYLFMNIPAIILLVIFIKCREKIDTNAEINKMNIQDIE